MDADTAQPNFSLKQLVQQYTYVFVVYSVYVCVFVDVFFVLGMLTNRVNARTSRRTMLIRLRLTATTSDLLLYVLIAI
jgi:hypothetical protein